MRKLKECTAKLSLRKKLIFSYILAVVLPISFIGYYFTSNIVMETHKQAEYTDRLNGEQLLAGVNDFFSKYIQISSSLNYDRQLVGYLNKSYADSVEYITKYAQYYDIDYNYTTNLAYQTIDGATFHVYTNNTELVCYNNFVRRSKQQDLESEWFQIALEQVNACNIAAPQKVGGVLSFSISTNLTPKSGLQNILRIEVPEANLKALIESGAGQDNIYIINAQQKVISSTDRAVLGAAFETAGHTGLQEILPETQGQVLLNRGSHTVYIAKIGQGTRLSDCWLVAVTSTEAFSAEIQLIILRSAGVCILIALLDILLIFIFSRNITSRITKLSTAIQQVREGNFDVEITDDGTDEISQFSMTIGEMLARINTLITEVYTSELNLKRTQLISREAEIHALQSQINPHFLFNTLESIKVCALRNNDLETCDILVVFSRLIRKTIHWDNDFIPLSSEIQLARDYMKMQKFRYRSRLEYEIYVQPGLEDAIIPKFTIQPIIENAISHGLEEKIGNGFVRILCEKREDLLEVTVWDDGVGIPPAQLGQLQKTLLNWREKDTAGDHIGLLNVHQRLKLYYGDDFGIQIRSIHGKETTVRLFLPLQSAQAPDAQNSLPQGSP